MMKQIRTIPLFFPYSLFSSPFTFGNINICIIKLLPKRYIQKNFVPALLLLRIHEIKNE